MISPEHFVIAFRKRGHVSEQELRYLHFRAEDDGNIIEIAELENDIQAMSRIDNPGSVVDDESEPSKRALPGELDEVLVRPEIVV